MSKNRSRPCVVDELELTPTFDKEPVKNNYLYKYNTFLKLSQIFDRTVGIARRLLDRMKVVRRKINLAICDSYGLSSVEYHLTIKFSKKGVAL